MYKSHFHKKHKANERFSHKKKFIDGKRCFRESNISRD